jgi:hypothetical protein
MRTFDPGLPGEDRGASGRLHLRSVITARFVGTRGLGTTRRGDQRGEGAVLRTGVGWRGPSEPQDITLYDRDVVQVNVARKDRSIQAGTAPAPTAGE